MKRIICSLLAFMLILGNISKTEVMAAENDMDSEEVVIFDAEIHERINELYEERASLVANESIDGERIKEIDEELVKLGVNEIDYYEVVAKLNGGVMPCLEIVDTPADGIDWTVQKMNVGYRTLIFEVHVVRAVPEERTLNSLLRHSDLEVTFIDKGTNVKGWKLLKLTAYTGLGFLPTTGTAYTVGFAFKDMLGILLEDDGKTVICDVESTFNSTYSSNEVFVLVKYQGSTDDMFELCYQGNLVNYDCLYTAIVPMTTETGGDQYFDLDLLADTAKSVNYDNHVNVAVKNFYNYKINGQSINYDDMIRYIDVEYLNHKKKLYVPRVGMVVQ